jgi:large subunit ribosomal protein L25
LPPPQERAMSEITVVAETGRPTGTRASGRLRAAGKVPGVLYGHGMTPLSVMVERRDLRHALTGPAGLNAVIDLQVDGATHSTVVKDLQRDKVRRNVTHVDFIVVNLNEEIEVEVPLILRGEAKAVVDEGGLVDLQLNTLTVSTTPRNIPNEIVIDISEMGVHDQVKVGDITLPANVTTPLDPDTLLVTVLITRAAPEPVAPTDSDGAAEPSDADAKE